MGQGDVRFAFELERVAGAKLLPIDGKNAAYQMDIGFTCRVERQLGALVAVEQARIDSGVGVDGERIVRAIGRGQQAQRTASLPGRDRFLLVARRDSGDFGFDPDLQKVRGLVGGRG